MTAVLVTGFTPFDGRTINASWIAAQAMARAHNLASLEIPVAWGAPFDLLDPICRHQCPDTIISMGEGRAGWFDIEIAARNTRKERADNNGQYPATRPILADGPDCVSATIDAHAVQRHLMAADVPARVSRDAGAFLCEETLYTLEQLKIAYAAISTVIFVHLPPFGTPVTFKSQPATCNESILAEFAELLFTAVMESNRHS